MILLATIIYRIFLLKIVLRFLIKKNVIGKPVAIVGAGNLGVKTSQELLNNEYSYFKPICFFDEHIKKTKINTLPVHGKINQINKYRNSFSEILITIENVDNIELYSIINKLKQTKLPIHVISKNYAIIKKNLDYFGFDVINSFSLAPQNNSIYIRFKRLFDILISCILLLVLLPLLIIISLIIKIVSTGPIFYSAIVVGKNCKSFRWYKFRSMRADTDDLIHRQAVSDMVNGNRSGEKLHNDPRIFPFGRLLRKFSLDELPQLYNVIKGDMSLVGPRPVLLYEFDLMKGWQKRKFEVIPGMTGLWQLYGRNKVGFNDQFILDIYYVENYRFGLDIKILLNTIPIVLFGKDGV